MPRGLTKRDEKQLEEIRRYQAMQPKQTYTEAEAVETWYRVRQKVTHKFPRGFLKDYDNVRAVIKVFVKETRRNKSRYPTIDDFKEAKLQGLLVNVYKGSPYRAFVGAGYTDPKSAVYDGELAEHPWTVIDKMPSRFWPSKENRVKAVKWLAEGSGKPVTELTQADFYDAGLAGPLLMNRGSPYKTLREAGYNIEPWEMHVAPKNFWRKRENRVRAFRWMVDRVDKPVTEINKDDLVRFGMDELSVYYGSIFEAIEDAGYDIDPVDMHQVPRGFWMNRKNRMKYTRRLVESSDKPPTYITGNDFFEAGLRGLLFNVSNSPHKALLEAGYKIDASRMEYVPNGHWKNPENRRVAIRRFVGSSRRNPHDLIQDDFEEAGLASVIHGYYRGSVYDALRDAGLDVDLLEMRRVPSGTWKRKDVIRAATKRVSESKGKSIDELTYQDFRDCEYHRLTTVNKMDEIKRIALEREV